MQRIRLLTSIQGDTEPVFGDAGDKLLVDDDVAAVWADGERAELLIDGAAMPPSPSAPVQDVSLVKLRDAAHAAAAQNEALGAATDALTAQGEHAELATPAPRPRRARTQPQRRGGRSR